jgi:hypothetical protein
MPVADPRFVPVTACVRTATTVRLRFSLALLVNAALTTASNYTVAGNTVSAAATVSGDPYSVDLTLGSTPSLTSPTLVTVSSAVIFDSTNAYAITSPGNTTYIVAPGSGVERGLATFKGGAPLPAQLPTLKGVIAAGGTSSVAAPPTVSALNGTTVRVSFVNAVTHSDPTADTDGLNPNNYLFSGGLVAASVAHVSGGKVFDVTLSSEMVQGSSYFVRTVFLSGGQFKVSFAGVGNLPTISNVACGDGHVDVTFSKPVDENTITLTAFAISIVTGGIVPLSIVGVKQLAADQYRFHTNTRATNAATYRLTHAGGVKDQVGNSMAGGLNFDFAGVSTLPAFTANILSATSILVTFDRTMSDDSELVNPANYTVDHNAKVVNVTKVSTSAVILTTTTLTPGVTYNVGVN